MSHKDRMERKRLGILVGKSQVLPSKEGGKGRREDEGGQRGREGWEELPMAGVLETWEMTVKKKQNASERSGGHGMKDAKWGRDG